MYFYRKCQPVKTIVQQCKLHPDLKTGHKPAQTYQRIICRPENSLAVLLLALIALASTGPEAAAQDALRVISGNSSNNNWIYYRDAPNAMYHQLCQEAFELLDKREQDIARLHTRAQWEQRRDNIRQTLSDAIGLFPEKTPLNTRIMRTIEKDFYSVEHIVFESQPGFFVTSSLYLPHGMQEPSPAILYASGHAAQGYRSSTYQHKILNLVKKGFIVFAFDPVSQGERIEYLDEATGNSLVGSATREHCYSGTQAFAIGSSLARHMIFDGIRAIDYLVTREEVDSDRIGMTGRSGGGTQTAYIAALDQRIHAAAPEAYISNFRRLLQTTGPPDAEQNLYHGLLRGLDHADYLAARAPKPTLVIATTEDYFSIDAARETAEELGRMYEALGALENFGLVEDGGTHTSTRKNREAMYAFFQKHLNNPGDSSDEEVAILSDEELRVTPTGQVATSLGGETIFSLNRKEADGLEYALQASRGDSSTHFADVVAAARSLSGYREPSGIGNPVFAGRIERDGYTIEKYILPGEGSRIIPYLLFVPNQANGRAILYLHSSGKAAEAHEQGDIVRFVNNGFTVLAPDLTGIGEMGPGILSRFRTRVKAYEPVSFDVWFVSVITGRSMVGIRAEETVRLARLLHNNMHSESVYAVAQGELSTVLLHAAAFEPSIERVALLQPVSSYRSLVMSRYYDPGLHHGIVAGALQYYDLPDLAGSLAPRSLFIGGVNDASMLCVDTQGIRLDNEIISMAYEYLQASDKLTISSCEWSERDYSDMLLKYWAGQ